MALNLGPDLDSKLEHRNTVVDLDASKAFRDDERHADQATLNDCRDCIELRKQVRGVACENAFLRQAAVTQSVHISGLRDAVSQCITFLAQGATPKDIHMLKTTVTACLPVPSLGVQPQLSVASLTSVQKNNTSGSFPPPALPNLSLLSTNFLSTSTQPLTCKQPPKFSMPATPHMLAPSLLSSPPPTQRLSFAPASCSLTSQAPKSIAFLQSQIQPHKHSSACLQLGSPDLGVKLAQLQKPESLSTHLPNNWKPFRFSLIGLPELDNQIGIQTVTDPVCKQPITGAGSGPISGLSSGSQRRKSESQAADMAQNVKKARKPRVTDSVPESLVVASKKVSGISNITIPALLNMGGSVGSKDNSEGSRELDGHVKPQKDDPQFPDPVYKLMRCSSVVGSFCEYIQRVHPLELVNKSAWRASMLVGPKESVRLRSAIERSVAVVNAVRRHASLHSLAGVVAAIQLEDTRGRQSMCDWLKAIRDDVNTWLAQQPKDGLSLEGWLSEQRASMVGTTSLAIPSLFTEIAAPAHAVSALVPVRAASDHNDGFRSPGPALFKEGGIVGEQVLQNGVGIGEIRVGDAYMEDEGPASTGM